jgi:hypothetical protein
VSDVPPPFTQQNQRAPRKKSNTPLIITIVVICVLVPCIGLIGLGYLGYGVWQKVAPMAGCAMAFDEVRKGIQDYADDHDGKLPNAATWQADVKKYVITAMREDAQQRGPIKAMDVNGPWGCAPTSDREPHTGMAFNTDVSSKKIADIKNPRTTVLIFEIPQPAENAHMPYHEPTQKAPMLFGKPRPWFYMPVRGGAHFKGTGNTWDFSDDNEKSSSSDSGDSSDSEVKTKSSKDAGAKPTTDKAKPAPVKGASSMGG